MATLEQKRGAILAKRIKTINSFLLEKMGTNTPFGEYLKSLGINEKEFMKDLPPYLVIGGISKATPDSKNLMEYGAALNLHLFNQKLIHDGKTKGTLSADAINNLSSAVVPANYIAQNADGTLSEGVVPANYIAYNADSKPPVRVRRPVKLQFSASGVKYYGTDKKGKLLHSATGEVVKFESADQYHRQIKGLTPYDGRDSSYVADGGSATVEQEISKLAKNEVIASGKFPGLTLENWANKTGMANLNITQRNQINQAYNKAYGEINSRTTRLTSEQFDGRLGSTIGDAIKDMGESVKGSIKGAGVGIKDQLNAINKLNPVFVVMRGAFLSLVAINAAGLASTLKAIRKDGGDQWKKLTSKWDKFGGDVGKLESTINNGSSKKPFPPFKKSMNANGELDEMTEEMINDPKNAGKIALGTLGSLGGLAALLASNPATAPAAAYVASAGGILAAFSPIIKGFVQSKGGDTSGIPDIKVDPVQQKAIDEVEDGSDIGEKISNFWDNYKAWIIGIIGFGTLATIVSLSSGNKK